MFDYDLCLERMRIAAEESCGCEMTEPTEPTDAEWYLGELRSLPASAGAACVVLREIADYCLNSAKGNRHDWLYREAGAWLLDAAEAIPGEDAADLFEQAATALRTVVRFANED